MLIKSTLVLVLATVALARDAVLSRGVFMGIDSTEKDASMVEIFKRPQNHATAAASAIRFAAESKNFRPYEMDPAKLCEHFDAWKNKITTFPGFRITRKPRPEDVNMEGGDEKLTKALHRGLRALQVPNADGVAIEFVHLIPEKNEDRSLKRFLLSVMIIDKPEKSMKVMMRLVELHLDLETSLVSKKVTIPDQTIRLKLVEMEVDTEYMRENADTLAQRLPRSDVSEFMWMLTSPQRHEFFDLEWPKQESVLYPLRHSCLSEWF
ncbi:hypothetical protein BGZ73_005496 [Actinomortierella ambigua]|nr:hypothetical protein BGZ73_005496 [Actinomortierella ambigua]